MLTNLIGTGGVDGCHNPALDPTEFCRFALALTVLAGTNSRTKFNEEWVWCRRDLILIGAHALLALLRPSAA